MAVPEARWEPPVPSLVEVFARCPFPMHIFETTACMFFVVVVVFFNQTCDKAPHSVHSALQEVP